MRILLAANASYLPPRGGATRGNIAWLQRLAARGHECRVVAAALPPGAADVAAQLRDEQTDLRPLLVYSSASASRRGELLREQVRDFVPDAVLVSSEDVGQPLLSEALRAAPGRVVLLAHTPQFLPFGPESWYPSAPGTELVRKAASVIVISRTMAGYVEQHLGRRPDFAHPPVYGAGPWPERTRYDDGLVTIVNPCTIKGLSIVIALARALPGCRFGAVPGWGTTAADRSALEALPNVSLLPNRRQIDDLLRETRVLLVPSLWYEGFGLVVIEAMLRGIPVVASDAGGLVEAKCGTRFVLPVRPIERYLPEYDERGLPRAVVPSQDIPAWVEAVRSLTSDRELYADESRTSRDAAARFVGALDPDALEERLLALSGSAHVAAASASLSVGERASAPAGSGVPLRILLGHNAPYFPALGGGDRSNRLLLAALAARGHACRVLARLPRFGAAEEEEYRRRLAARGVETSLVEDGMVGFPLDGVEVRVLASHAQPRAAFAREIAAFAPDVILVSTDDPAQLLLAAALEQAPGRVVYLVRAPLALPFGPESAFPSAAKTELLHRADRVVAVSEYVARYVREWGGLEAVHVPISLMEPGPYPELGRFDNELVTLVNPCAVKGLPILLELVDRLPDLVFAAVPTWGTTEEDRRLLAARPNVRLLAPVDRIDELLARTRVLLVPSLWQEARSRIVVEAMLRGVPVLASDVGGIREAMLGVPYLLPVRPIVRFRPELDEQMVPRAEVPAQDVAPWRAALQRLTSDRAHYEELSHAARAAALDYVGRLSVAPFETLLRETTAQPSRREQGRQTSAAARGPGPEAAPTPAASTPAVDHPAARADPRAAIARLSPEKRELLALRLKKRIQGSGREAAADAWFPGSTAASDASARLFCLAHAGAGPSVFRGWNDGLPGSIRVCGVALPGRESRAEEPAFRDMSALVAALGAAIAPLTATTYALFGHSMGAGIAFELARWLRSRGRPLPFLLVVSGTPAPQLRLGRQAPSEPKREDLLAELRARGGVAGERLEDPELLRMLLPLLEADTALYRAYRYVPGEPLPLPIRAYGGASDPHVRREDLEAWRAQTTVSFELRLFAGGHFYLQDSRAELLQALGGELERALAYR